MGSGVMTPRTLNLGTRWRCVVSYTPRTLCSRVSSSQYPEERTWVGRRDCLKALAKCPYLALPENR
jgi:hypothetical protein